MRGDPSAEALSYKQVSRSASEPLPLTLGTQGVLLIGVGSGMMSLVDGQDVLWGCLRLASRCPRSLRRMRPEDHSVEMRRSPCAANGRRGLCPSLSMRSDMVAKLASGGVLA